MSITLQTVIPCSFSVELMCVVELSGRCFSGSNCLDANVGSCRPAVRKKRVGMQLKKDFYRDNNTSNIWIQSTDFRCMREPMTAPRLLAMKDMRLSHGQREHESTISHKEVSEGKQKKKRQEVREI